jgi:hypothetical protein
VPALRLGRPPVYLARNLVYAAGESDLQRHR